MIARFRCLFSSVWQEYKLLLAHPSALMVIIAVPLVYPALVSWLYIANQPVERPTIIVDDANTALSRQLVLDLDATQELRVIEQAPSVEQGWQGMMDRHAEVLIYIPENLPKRVKHGQQGHIKVWVNGANMLTYGIAYPAVASVVAAVNEELGAQWMRNKGLTRSVAQARVSPIRKAERAVFNATWAYGAFLVPGVLLLAIQQAVLIGLVFSAGFSMELGASGVHQRFPFTWLEGKFLAHIPFHLAGTAFVVFGVFSWFGWPVANSWALFGVFCALAMCVVPIGIVVASLVKDRFASLQLLMFFTVPMFMMSGFSWPLSQMPWYVRAVAVSLPVTPALGALRVITMKTDDVASLLPWLQWMLVCFAGWMTVAFVVVHRLWRRVFSWFGSDKGKDAASV